jgi:hypothetical protein
MKRDVLSELRRLRDEVAHGVGITSSMGERLARPRCRQNRTEPASTLAFVHFLSLRSLAHRDGRPGPNRLQASIPIHQHVFTDGTSLGSPVDGTQTSTHAI